MDARGERRTLAEALAEREVVKMADMCCGAGARVRSCVRGDGTRSNGSSSVAKRAFASGRAVCYHRVDGIDRA